MSNFTSLTSAASKHCRKLEDPNPFTVALASVLVAGILVSYLPQHIKIIQRRSSEGLSPWWVLLGALSSIAAIGNIFLLPASRADVKCCKEVSGASCAAALLGIAQIGCQWSCFMFIVMLFLTFFPTEIQADLTSSPPPKRRDALIVGLSTLLALLVVGITSIALIARAPSRTQSFADLLGVVAGLLSAVQYLPQIWYTYRLGDVKSLSILTMLIQVPGSCLFAFSLWLRVSWEGWSTWLVYIITGCLQATLLSMAITFWLVERGKQEHDYDSVGDVNDVDGVEDGEEWTNERTPLVGSATKGRARPINGTQRSASDRQFGMLYAATPPEHDSDRSSGQGK